MNIVLATRNTGKLEEFRELVLTTTIDFIPLSDYTDIAAEETGLTFIENAILKARYACQITGRPSLADDSGLVVPALKGAPGIYSARYAGVHGDGKANVRKLLNDMKTISSEKRQAYFQCVLAFMRSADDPSPIVVEGCVHGEVLHEERGDRGFGYDPVVFLPEKNCTMAEMCIEEKNKISHRAKAMQALLTRLQC